jgi:hypothetical protein
VVMDIERIQWWIEAESIKLRIRADRERLEKMEKDTFCRQVNNKNQNKDDKNSETNHEDQAKG